MRSSALYAVKITSRCVVRRLERRSEGALTAGRPILDRFGLFYLSAAVVLGLAVWQLRRRTPDAVVAVVRSRPAAIGERGQERRDRRSGAAGRRFADESFVRHTSCKYLWA
jgi:hypothetical protein